MNLQQLFNYQDRCSYKASMLRWHIDTVNHDLSIYPISAERRNHWLNRVAQAQEDLNMFQNEYDLTHEDVKMELGHIEVQIRNLHRYKLDILAIEGLVQREERTNGKS